jgi:hypothetical protein
LFNIYTYLFHSVLHPYYKLAYIKLAWGGPEEQTEERRKGNPHAKDWQDEAKQIVEKTVSYFILLNLYRKLVTDEFFLI